MIRAFRRVAEADGYRDMKVKRSIMDPKIINVNPAANRRKHTYHISISSEDEWNSNLNPHSDIRGNQHSNGLSTVDFDFQKI